jgi:hypothetical protein
MTRDTREELSCDKPLCKNVSISNVVRCQARVAFFSFHGINRIAQRDRSIALLERHLTLELGGQHGEESEQEDQVEIRDQEDGAEVEQEGQPEEVVRLLRRYVFGKKAHRNSRRGRSAESARRPRRIAPATFRGYVS